MRLLLALALGACAVDPALPLLDPFEDPLGNPACPPGMVLIEGEERFCVDAVEAALVEILPDGSEVPFSPYETVEGRRVKAVSVLGQIPQGYISGEEAGAACEEAGKALCTRGEWLRACQGPLGTTFPYGTTRVAGACNDTYEGGHPVIDYFGTSSGVFDSVHMNDPGINQQPNTVAPGGAFGECVSAEGAYDMVGNLHEWIAEPEGTFKGGFYADAQLNGPGCTYTTTAHAFGYHDYSTGFRCCAAPLF
jgi:formylglycine-generating enzyme